MAVSARLAAITSVAAIVVLSGVVQARPSAVGSPAHPRTVSELRDHAAVAGHGDDRRGLLDALLDLHLGGHEGSGGSLPIAATFELYVELSGKAYPMGSSVWGERLQAFATNMEIIAAHNKSRSFTLGLNQYADWKAEEFESVFLGGLASSNKQQRGVEGSEWVPPAVPNPEEEPARYLPFEYERTIPVAQRVDWREVGAVGPVKNQHIEAPGAGPCSCCWAFAAIGALESAIAVESNSAAPSLSEQQLIACDYHPDIEEANHGCQTGLWWLGWDYIINNGGVRPEAEWPYLARNSDCDRAEHSPAAAATATMSRYEFIDYWNETALLGAVTHQPVAIEVCVGKDFLKYWQLYSGGVYDIEGCMDNMDHALLVVGYDLDGHGGRGTWLIKNSWGEDWGEGGYMRVPLGMGPEPAPGKRMGIFNMYHRPGHPSLTSNPKREAGVSSTQLSRAERLSDVE